MRTEYLGENGVPRGEIGVTIRGESGVTIRSESGRLEWMRSRTRENGIPPRGENGVLGIGRAPYVILAPFFRCA